MKTKTNLIRSLTCTLIILPVISMLSLQAQDYYITFSGSGKSSTVDSVIVENLTQGTKLVLKGTDTLHLVKGTTGIETISGNVPGKIKFYPNPMQDQTKMEFDLPEPGETIISIFDLAGREIGQTRNMLSQGRHAYLVQGVIKGLYIVRINSGSYSFSGRLISSDSRNTGVRLLYKSTETNILKQEEEGNSKGINDIELMNYNPGEILKYIAFSGNSTTVTTDVPSITGNNYTINSVFVDCRDADFNDYSVVRIGKQIWMAENLRTSILSNGVPIPNLSDNAEWDNITAPAYSWFNNNILNKNVYGALYNWYSVGTGMLCPVDWHVPDDTEWHDLVFFIDPLAQSILGAESSITGEKLKETGIIHWKNPNLATNETGFTALPGGYRYSNGNFFHLGEYATWWSSSDRGSGSTNSYYRSNIYNYKQIFRDHYYKDVGMSVRCLKDYIKDYDGNLYSTVTIGNQTWMNENLKTTHYNDGTDIPQVTDKIGWTLLTDHAYCWYNNDITNRDLYGALYNGFAINTGKLCPTGWHIPTDNEWTVLTTYLGGEEIAGGKLKEPGIINWKNPNTGATNESGFKAFPGGLRYLDGEFSGIGEYADWWSDAEWFRELSYAASSVFRLSTLKIAGFSVRCLKDDLVKDYDGNIYKTVKIGYQTWQGENLKTRFLKDGTPIPLVSDVTAWSNLTTSGYCWYDNNEEFYRNTYGALYNWHTVNTGKLCPTGWHMPTDDEWSTLSNFISNNAGKLKEAGTEHWQSPNIDATNETGFTALPGGDRSSSGLFEMIGYKGNWWTASSTDTENAWLRNMSYNNNGLGGTFSNFKDGLSVRCLKDYQSGSLKDYDGNIYTTITIGNQVWLAENLRTTHFNDGYPIELVTDDNIWDNLTSPGYCWYNNDEATNKNTYGALYNWYTVNTAKLCPAGWHVPTENDWTILSTTLGGEHVTGGKLKETGLTHWPTPNTDATNEISYTALPGGYRLYTGSFKNIGINGYWWSSTEYSAYSAMFRSIFNNDSNLYKGDYGKGDGISVRCVKD